jgi:hypothetical protein
MAAGKTDLTIEQGATWSQVIYYQTAANVPISLANCTLRMMARSAYSANSTVLSLSSATGGISITNAANGTFALQQTALQTSNLTAGTYVYDLELVKADSTVDRLLQGSLIVVPEVTR